MKKLSLALTVLLTAVFAAEAATACRLKIDIDGRDAKQRIGSFDGNSSRLAVMYAAWLPEESRDMYLITQSRSPLTEEWSAFEFSFTPSTTGQVFVSVRGIHSGPKDKVGWSVYRNLEVAGASFAKAPAAGELYGSHDRYLRYPLAVTAGEKVTVKVEAKAGPETDKTANLLANPPAAAAAVPAAAAGTGQVAIWLVGDSTVASYQDSRAPLSGWGQVLGMYCRPEVMIQNRAISGRSSKSFIDEGAWEKIAPRLKKGDFLLIQFGHNDQKKEKATHYTDPATTFPEHLSFYIDDARSKGATPILVTPVCRRVFKDGKMTNTLGAYPDAMRRLAAAKKVDLIDLNAISFEELGKLGEAESVKLFNHQKGGEYPAWPKPQQDNTHFNRHGAEIVAAWVVADAKRQKLAIARLFK